MIKRLIVYLFVASAMYGADAKKLPDITPAQKEIIYNKALDVKSIEASKATATAEGVRKMAEVASYEAQLTAAQAALNTAVEDARKESKLPVGCSINKTATSIEWACPTEAPPAPKTAVEKK